MKKRILCLSNGHGEDAIAVVILKALQAYDVELTALPIVGEGTAYKNLGIPIIGPTQTMPSGGFIYMDLRQLWQDLKQGLGSLTLKQLATIKAIAATTDLVLAVGDIVVQLAARYMQCPYVFIGTAKSDYYLYGKPSVFLPWERWMMRDPACLAVYPRDRITTENLGQLGITCAHDLGNPMMDGLEPQGFDWHQLDLRPTQQVITILPGSRPPEAYRNFGQLLTAITYLQQLPASLKIVAALAPSVRDQALIQALAEFGWSYQQISTHLARIDHTNWQVYLVWQAFNDCLQRADLVLAMAGTATEQAVGLGKPVITFPGLGPQFNERFAEAQTRLLGVSVTLVAKPETITATATNLLTNQTLRAQIAMNGLERMGQPGAAQRIAAHMMKVSH